MFLVLHLHAWQVGAGGLGAWIGSGSVQQDSWVVTGRCWECLHARMHRVSLMLFLELLVFLLLVLGHKGVHINVPKVVLFVHGAEIVIKSVPSFLSAHPYSATSFKPYCV